MKRQPEVDPEAAVVDRRCCSREPCSIVVEGPDADGVDRAILIRDISAAGMGGQIFWSWKTGEEVNLKLYPNPTSEEVYAVRARVCWIQPGEPGSAGFEFLSTPPGFHDWLSRFSGQRASRVEHTWEPVASS